ncbi:unnamed protein product [Mytilus coruscus]|uniref:Uncharacterized protein n=1 Tax=Mytilus coruscus TaxID=42192 RepID=A0A6J8D4I2_MYTCO|nr:unnamed protein product [Mytilus coruscus]
MKTFVAVLLGIILNEVLPKPTEKGPHMEPCVDPLDCLHGVLMHGDNEVGDSHKTEDNYLKFKPVLETGPKEKSGPQDAEETFHGALMHDDKDHPNNHNEDKTEQPEKPPESFGPKETNKFMHDVMHGDTEKSHEHVHEKIPVEITNKDPTGPPDAEQIMHGVLMHGGENVENHHVHSRPEDTTQKSNGPMDQNTLMHNLMHDGNHVDHLEEKANVPASPSGPNSEKLHGILMHGDSEIGNEHDHDHKESNNVPFKFNLDEIKKLGIDPEILKTVLSEDQEDYSKWQTQKLSGTDEDYYKGTYVSISDSSLADIELMKQRYIKQELDSEEQKEFDAYVNAKDSDLNSDEMASNLNLDSMDHDTSDMHHDLELIGSTQPINEIHNSHREHKHRR